MEKSRLLQAIRLLAALPSGDDDAEAALVAGGFSAIEARILAAFVPEAFAVPVLQQLGVTVADHVPIINGNGEWEDIPLRDVAIYQSTRGLLKECVTSGILGQRGYEGIASRSALLATLNEAINAGSDVSGGTAAIAPILATVEDLRSS
jgi:hypothetical protein